MANSYSYYSWEGIPCRAAVADGELAEAEMYKGGQGFVPVALHTLTFKARPIDKQAFDKLLLAIVSAGRSRDQQDA